MKLLSCVRVFATPWTVAYQALGFPSKSTGVGCPIQLYIHWFCFLVPLITGGAVLTFFFCCNCRLVHFLLDIYQFLLHVFWSSVVRHRDILNYVFLENNFLSLFFIPGNFLRSKVHLSDVTTVTSSFFWLVFAWYFFSHPFTFFFFTICSFS